MAARRAQEAAHKADAAAALPRARTMPQLRLRLVTGQMPSLRDLRQLSA
jgi:hypothetical protein